MRFEDVYFSRENKFSIGIDNETKKRYLSIPVSNGMVDYEEYYEISNIEYEDFINSEVKATEFADQARRRLLDTRLIVSPGSSRGSAI